MRVIILHTLKNIKNTFRTVLPINLFVLMIHSASLLFFTKKKKTVHRFIEAILEEYNYCRGVIIIHFNKNLVMFEEDKQRIQSSNMCWICDKSFAAEDY